METWRKVWREGIAPYLAKYPAGLEALYNGLVNDDLKILQGATTSPPPLMCVADWDCEAGCIIAYVGMNADNPTIKSVGEVEAFFACCCFEADKLLGEPAAIRWFLNWADETPRDEMRCLLLPEVRRALDCLRRGEPVTYAA